MRIQCPLIQLSYHSGRDHGMNKCLQIVVVLLIAAGFFAGVFKRMMEVYICYLCAVIPKQQLDSKETSFKDLVFQLKKVAFAQAGWIAYLCVLLPLSFSILR